MRKVGRSEYIYLPDLNIVGINGKVDTGAYGNVMHVDDIDVVDNILYFKIGDCDYSFDKYDTISVRSSFGRKQTRYAIFTRIGIGDKIFKVKLSLTDRAKMKYPMLIGRRFLRKFKYIVDVRKINIADK